MGEDSIKLTYETLFEFLRIEKNRGELQKLDKTFMNDVAAYLLEKSNILLKDNEQSQLFGEQEKLKTLNELANIKKLIKELYERRERKIIDIVLNKSRTNSSIITSANLLPEEMSFYENLLKIMNDNRRNVLHSILDTERAKNLRTKTETSMPAQDKLKDTITLPINESKGVRFLQIVPKFVGKELETYGPFQEGDIADLPMEIAEILILKGKAVNLNV